MKVLYKITLLMIISLVWSCEKDKHINSYSEKEIITVKGLDANYSLMTGRDNISVEPEVSSNKEGELEYMWGIYETNVQGYNPVIDTISRTRKLDYPLTRVAKDWFLFLQVTNKKTGYSQYFNSTLKVGTAYTRGWYVAKDESDMSDLDFFSTSSTIIPDGKIENVYSLVNGIKLKGKAVATRFFSDFKAPSNGTYANTRAIALVSEQDIGVVDLSSLKLIRDFNTLFYGLPMNRKLNMIGNDFLVYFMVNDGQLHSLVGQGLSTGVFGGRKIMGNLDSPYHLSRYHIMYISSYFFDEISSSFVSATDRSMYLRQVVDNPGTQLSANNNNKKLIFMGTKTTGPLQGYAIFQDKTDPSLKSLAQINPIVQSFRIANNTVLNTADKIYNGKNFALLYQDENMIYFSSGNEVWSRNLSNHFEQKQFTVPANESITLIKHLKYAGSGIEAPYSFNYVMVGTSSGGNYKIRMFTKASGNLAGEPTFTLEGKGSAVDAVYVGPPINNTTYPFTY